MVKFRGRMGAVRSEEGEKSIALSFIRRTLSLAAIRAQSHSLLGRLKWREERRLWRLREYGLEKGKAMP